MKKRSLYNRSRRAREGVEYNCTLSSTSALDGMGGQRHAPAPLHPGKILSTYRIEGWVGPRAGLGGCEKNLAPTGVRSPDRPSRSESLYRRYPGPLSGQHTEPNFKVRTVQKVGTARALEDGTKMYCRNFSYQIPSYAA